MEEKIDTFQQKNKYFLFSFLTLQEQRQKLRCSSHNQATSVCISKDCTEPGLMCFQKKCSCRIIHFKCHHILIDRVLQSIQKHQKQIPAQVKQIYQSIYDIINQMIQKLSKLRTKFQKEQQYFGLRQQQLQFMDLINDTQIDLINGKIVSSLEKTFDVQIQLNINTKQDIIKDFEKKAKQFDKLCSYIQESYAQTRQINSKNKLLNQGLFNHSKIVLKNQQKQMLNTWLKQQFNNKQIQSKLLFRATQYDFKAKKFHQLCDGKNDTFVICLNQYDKIIGGFTPIAWSSDCKDGKDQTDKSFVFSINMKQKFKYVNKNNRSIYCGGSIGPTFGPGHPDFWLTDSCNQKANSYGQLGGSYNFKINGSNKYTTGSQETRTLFTGNPKDRTFRVKQYQVYQITQK